ncbi:MAG TPA: respiratory nitrate reductase subunit gamma [Aquificales bacterium]|nr:respiratory nitrate reductase subunit gamma [Aquificales bacterium]
MHAETAQVGITDYLFWVALPYAVLAIFVLGHIYRYITDPMSWTSKSSELLEKKLLRFGSMPFHYGIILVLAGHVIGLLIPKAVHEALGLSDHVYHIIAVIGGLFAGFLTLLGLIVLTYRRFAIKRVLANSSAGDIVVLVLLLLVVLAGLTATLSNIDGSFDYRENIAPWLRGILTLRPDPTLMVDVPIIFKLHIFLVMLLFAVWPFTRLVHVLSFPVVYIWRSYIVFRRRCGDMN